MSIEKQKLYNEIETLPEELTIQVVNFIEFLKLSYVDGEAPESVTIKSKKDLKEKLQNACDDKEQVQKYKDEAADYICGKYNWDDVVERTLELYRR